MSHIIIDRRKNKKKSSVNRQKFLKRSKVAIKEHIKNVVSDGNIEDINNGSSDNIKISKKTISEPRFIFNDETGTKEWVLPGNDRFIAGDQIEKNKKGGGKGNQASNGGEGEDDFIFTISQKEFIEYFFEDLELPDLTKRVFNNTIETSPKRAGFSNVGTPNRLDLLRSMKKATGRRIALALPKRKKIKKLEEELKLLKKQKASKTKIQALEEEIKRLKRKLKAVPFVDTLDLQYREWNHQPVPISQAVMFCIMDVSGSMGQREKDLAKRFFMLLYLFLTQNYEKIEIVFIRHHTTAKEVDQEEFFYSKETGGTIVSSAFELTKEIIDHRYPPSKWNTYICQASDGDNWMDDNHKVYDILAHLLPRIQYHFYVELISEMRSGRSDLMDCYDKILANFDNIEVVQVGEAKEIWPVFRKLFKKSRSSN